MPTLFDSRCEAYNPRHNVPAAVPEWNLDPEITLTFNDGAAFLVPANGTKCKAPSIPSGTSGTGATMVSPQFALSDAVVRHLTFHRLGPLNHRCE